MSCAPPDMRAPLDPGSPSEDALAAAYVRGRDDERRLRPIYVPVCRDCGAEVERGQPCKAVGCPPYAAAAPVREIGARPADFASMHDEDTHPHRPDPISLGERGPWDEEDEGRGTDMSPANETGWYPGALDWIAEHAGDIAAVIVQTERDDEGVSYEVLVRDRTVTTFEGSEDLRSVWSASVRFGHTDATVAGGSAFRFAAQEQEKAVERVVGAIRGRG